MRTALRFLTLILAGGLAGSIQAADKSQAGGSIPEAYEGFTAPITAEIARHRIAYNEPGISIALVDAAGTSWSSSFGIADRNSGRKVDAGTIFEMGSISKLFTCAAILQLHEQGLVDLDRPLRDYLPGFDSVSRFSTGAEVITVRMLMTHHSGLMMDDDTWETSAPERYFYRAVFEYIKDKPLLFPPGQKMRYSSFGPNLLGLLIEKVSGLEYTRYMREKLLVPLEMPNANFDVQDQDPARLAKAYNYHPVWDLIPMEEIRPAGSLRAPVAEVAHFATMILAEGEYRGRRVLSHASIAEMTRIQNPDNCLDAGARMALGFMAEPHFLKTGAESELVILYHIGQARTKSLLLIIPAWRKGLILSCNDYSVTDASYDLFSKVWNRYLRTLFAGESQPYDYHRPIPDRAEPSSARLDEFAGDYATTHGARSLATSGMALEATPGGNRFIPLTDGCFTTEPWTFPRVLFRFGGAEATATIDGYPIDRWERLGPPDLPASLTRCAGVYAAAGSSVPRSGIARIDLRVVAGRLLVHSVRTEANERLALDAPGALFPLRFTGPDRAEVVNGALSGFFGYQFVFKPSTVGMELLLVDGLGTITYNRLP